jgi:hypothetical protein
MRDEVELGMEAILSELARSLSTAAFTRYAIAKRLLVPRKKRLARERE